MMQFKPELSFHEITVPFLEKYKAWMQNDYRIEGGKKLHENSIWKALSFVRMVYKYAIKNEVILPDGNPFNKFIVGSYEQDTNKIKFLEMHEMDRLEKELTENQSIPELTRIIGWRFLCMCVSGMRISDAMRLDEYFFNDNGDLQFNPHKTRKYGNQATIPITWDRQRKYFEISLTHQLPKTDSKNFRTTFNDCLKVLAAHAKITINLTSHVGRHTMGGFLVDAGVEESSAKKILGVKSNKVIKTYLHLKQDKLRDEASKLGRLK